MSVAVENYDGLDPVGEETLEALAKADKLNKWMYDTISPYLKGDVMEIGSGIGNISQFCLANKHSMVLTDLRTNYCDTLQQKFGSFPNLKGIHKVDLVHPDFDTKYAHLLGKFDSIFALNVVEHIKDHELAIANCRKLLRPAGNLIILVPAFQFLYNRFDKELEHFRRYTKKRLRNLISSQGFDIIHSSYFNAIGILGWFFSGTILRKKVIPSNQLNMYNKLVPVFRLIDKLGMRYIAGLSVITVGTKPSAAK